MMRLNLYLIAAIVLSILTITSILPHYVYAQSKPKPSVPEFTAEFVDRSYTVPARTYIDPYTGEQVTDPSYFVENKTIKIVIKNQPYFSAAEIAYLCYNIHEKGYFENTWKELYHITNKTNDNALIRASDSEYTIISLDLPTPKGQIDFQVKAYFTIGNRFFGSSFGTWSWEESDWSNTKTVTIPEESSPTPSPTIPELTWIALLPLCLIVLGVALVVFKRRKRTDI